jgi:hypothetical protein
MESDPIKLSAVEYVDFKALIDATIAENKKLKEELGSVYAGFAVAAKAMADIAAIVETSAQRAVDAFAPLATKSGA